MKNSSGTALKVTLFGESHGPALGAVLDGLPPGFEIDEEALAADMAKRMASSEISTARREPDELEWLSGVYEGRTTGAPLCFLVRNTNTRSGDYLATAHLPRPGHADYTAHVKYAGFNDPRGGGHFSGRLTAPLVAAGALCRQILAAKGVQIATHLARCGGVDDAPLPADEAALRKAIALLNASTFAVLDEAAGAQMRNAILSAKAEKDSVGGVLETAVVGIPAGLGEPFFGSVESTLAALFFSIPAVKGVEFGAGFAFADLMGSQAADEWHMAEGAVRARTNNNGGINGGISNGMPLLLRAVVKATPSIAQPLNTVDLNTGADATLQTEGRHDPCILPRARAVADAVTALGLLDLWVQHRGLAGFFA